MLSVGVPFKRSHILLHKLRITWYLLTKTPDGCGLAVGIVPVARSETDPKMGPVLSVRVDFQRVLRFVP